MPSPCRATSCEVIPPLATTQAGRAASASRTVRDRAADTARRRPGCRRRPARGHDAAGEQQHIRIAQRGGHPPCRPGRHLAAADDGRDVKLDGGDPARRAAPPAGGWSGRRATPPRPGRAALRGPARPPDVRAAQRRPRAHPGQRAHDRGPVRNRNHAPARSAISTPAEPRPGRSIGRPPRPSCRPAPRPAAPDSPPAAEPDVGQADAADVAPPDRAAALLRHEVTQFRCAVAERGVPRELGLAHRDEAPAPRAQRMSPAGSRPASRNAAPAARRHSRGRPFPGAPNPGPPPPPSRARAASSRSG